VPPPHLDKDADPNDWEAYYDYGVKVIRKLPSKADAAFYWSERMDPRRAEPIFGRWAAFWMLDASEYFDFIDGNPRVLAEPQMAGQDSLLRRAFARNPFVNQALIVLLVEHYLVRGDDNPIVRGWVAYANGYYPLAIENFRAAVHQDPDRGARRYDLAMVYVQQKQYDSAAAQLREMLSLARRDERGKLTPIYESKEILQYGLGLIYAAAGRLAEARDAQEQALTENLAYAPAHAALAQLAAARRDTGAAAAEFALAVELAPGDGAMRFWYGGALLRAQRPAEAVEQLRTAIRLEPYFAESYYLLGAAYAAENDTAEALTAYTGFLKHTPRNATELIGSARSRITALGGHPPP
jgi:Tfp pilus assembly protein PilF